MFKKIKPKSEWIIYDENPILREKSHPIDLPLKNDEIELIEKMVSYIDASYYNKSKKYNIKPGIGIAAIQLGVKKQIIYIHFDENDIENKFLIANPKIIKEFSNNSYIENGEGCLSVKKNYDGYSIRKSKIIVEAINLYNNEKITIVAEGILSCCLQHEIDHLNGKLYYDRINKFNPFYKKDDWNKIE